MPNLMQTLQQTPAFVHVACSTSPTELFRGGRPDRKRILRVTESGLAPTGMEKFFDIRPHERLILNCVVLVATVRA